MNNDTIWDQDQNSPTFGLIIDPRHPEFGQPYHPVNPLDVMLAAKQPPVPDWADGGQPAQPASGDIFDQVTAANPFDIFDQVAASQRATANPFDQFDAVDLSGLPDQSQPGQATAPAIDLSGLPDKFDEVVLPGGQPYVEGQSPVLKALEPPNATPPSDTPPGMDIFDAVAAELARTAPSPGLLDYARNLLEGRAAGQFRKAIPVHPTDAGMIEGVTGAPEYPETANARALQRNEVPSATAQPPTLDEIVRQASTIVPESGIEVPRKIETGEPESLPEAYEQGGVLGAAFYPRKVSDLAERDTLFPPPKNKAEEVIRGVASFPLDVADFLTTPEGAATIAGAGTGVLARTAIALGFTIDQVKSFIELV